jgi:hypothetical protein
MTLTLPFVTVQNEYGVALLGFANEQFNTTQYLLLQRTLEPDDQDRALGQDRVHIELNDRSAYGDVEEARLENGRLVLRLDPLTANQLSGGETIEVAFGESMGLDIIATQLRVLIGVKFCHDAGRGD